MRMIAPIADDSGFGSTLSSSLIVSILSPLWCGTALDGDLMLLDHTAICNYDPSKGRPYTKYRPVDKLWVEEELS